MHSIRQGSTVLALFISLVLFPLFGQIVPQQTQFKQPDARIAEQIKQKYSQDLCRDRAGKLVNESVFTTDEWRALRDWYKRWGVDVSQSKYDVLPESACGPQPILRFFALPASEPISLVRAITDPYATVLDFLRNGVKGVSQPISKFGEETVTPESTAPQPDHSERQPGLSLGEPINDASCPGCYFLPSGTVAPPLGTQLTVTGVGTFQMVQLGRGFMRFYAWQPVEARTPVRPAVTRKTRTAPAAKP